MSKPAASFHVLPLFIHSSSCQLSISGYFSSVTKIYKHLAVRASAWYALTSIVMILAPLSKQPLTRRVSGVYSSCRLELCRKSFVYCCVSCSYNWKKWCVPALCLRNCTSWNYDVLIIRTLEQYRVLFSCVTTFLTRKNPYLASTWTDTRDKIVFPLLIVSKVDRYLFVCPRIHNSIQYQKERHKHSTTAVSMTRYFRKSLRCNENRQSTSSGKDDRNLFYKIPSRPPKTFSLNFHVKKGLCSRKTHNETTIIITNFLKQHTRKETR